VEGVQIEIDSIEVLPFSSTSRADVRRSGEPGRESLRNRAAHAGPIADDTLVYRIDFHVVSWRSPMRQFWSCWRADPANG
jgi:hypothetical protein